MSAARTNATVERHYSWIASIYDWANLEGTLYADARMRAIALLELQPGARVLDVACGTGADFALIRPTPWRSPERDTDNPVVETFTWGWVTPAACVKAAQ